MAEARSRFDEHWRTFELFREQLRQRSVMLGVDRTFARIWVLRGGTNCPLPVQLVGYLLILFGAVGIAGAIFAALSGAYLLAVLLALLAYLSWRLFFQLAIASSRAAALRDETLFRRWFDERRLSTFVKATGEYVWNDQPVAR